MNEKPDGSTQVALTIAHTSRVHPVPVRVSADSVAAVPARIPGVFVSRDSGKCALSLPGSPRRAIELTLRLGEPQHVHGTSKRENDFIIWRTAVFQWPAATWRYTKSVNARRSIFCFLPRFGRTSTFLSIDVFIVLFLRVARSTRVWRRERERETVAKLPS